MPASFEPAPAQPPEPHAMHVGGDGPTGGLPPAVADKVFRIREITSDLHRRLPELDERQAAAQARGEAQRRLDRLLAHPHQGGFGLDPDTDVRVVQQRRVLAEATVAADRIAARYEAASAEWQPAARTRRDIDTMLRNRRHGTAFAEYVAEPKLAKTETIIDAVARLGRRCRELRADAHRVESAPYPSAFAKERVREIVQTWAQQGTPNVSPLIEHEAGQVWWPTKSLQSTVMNVAAEAGRPIAFAESEAVIPTLAWLFPEAMVERLTAMLAQEADDGAALSVADRQTQGAQIAGDLLAVEHDLGAMVWRGLDQRLPVWFDADQNAMTIIGAQLVTELATNGAGSSPQHAGYDLRR